MHMGPCAWGVCAVFPPLWRASSVVLSKRTCPCVWMLEKKGPVRYERGAWAKQSNTRGTRRPVAVRGWWGLAESEFEKAGTPRTPFSPAAGPSFFACGDPGEGHSVPLRARVSR